MLKNAWYAQLPRKLHLDYHEPEWMTGIAEHMTPQQARQQARMFREAGVQSVSFFLHDHHGYCFFPSRLGKPHPHLAQDYVGVMVEALHAEGIKAIGYFCVFTNIHLKDQHPDWFVVSPDGVYPAGAWLQYEHSAVCPSSPYLEQYVIPVLQEALLPYQLDGIWLDGGSWFSDTLCSCVFCQEEFPRSYGPGVANQQPTSSEAALACETGDKLEFW